MELHFYTPESDILKQYIEGYYFLSDFGTGASKEYTTFPNNYCIVTVNLNSEVKLDINHISIEPTDNSELNTSFAYRYKKPINVHYRGVIKEITVYFRPLGINYFVDNLETMFSQKKMTEFIPQFSDFKDEMHKIFNIDNRLLQIDALEDYWLSKMMMMKDLELLKSILSDAESNLKVEDIAKKHHISRKHLNNVVQKNLGKPLSEYRKIFRFRNVINNYQGLKSLTELCYEHLFFDQSHLIKDFKSLTEINPNLFFKNVNTANKNVWLFI
ncbi:MAG: AraC family transcriptional regulator [Pedobacter sp.]|nr:MAG: AraC family transcriptional regulator [Pedobacter sp.]